MAKTPKTFVLRRPEQLAALASPVRSRIIESLAVDGPSSVRQIATRLDRPPEALYYHIRGLVDVGLVVLEGKRKVGRRAEAVYRMIAMRLVLDTKQRSKAYIDAMAGTCSAMLRLAERNYRAAVDRGGFALDGPQRSLMVRRYAPRLDRAGLAQLNRLLDRVAEMYDEQYAATGGDPYAVTIVLSQLSRRPDDRS
jgi:DNA-binding transcriptional ArsR family regulator